MKKFLTRIGAAVAAIAVLTSCKADSVITFADVTPTNGAPTADVTASPSPAPTESPSPSPTPSPTPTPYDGSVNPLTGLPTDETAAKLRPAAVMINNIKEALPMSGLASADLIFETLAEGGVTRLLAVFQNPANAEAVGSVRSARHYFIDLAQGLDAVYVHAGGSPQAYTELQNRKVDHMDGVTTVYDFFYRDKNRSSYAMEHRLFLNGAKLAEYLDASTKIRRTHADNYADPLTFADDGTPKVGTAIASISVTYSAYKTGVFTYDAATSTFLVSEYGKPMTDGASSKQLAVTNVVILKTNISKIAGDAYGRLNVTLTGEGEGWYACGGVYTEITWSKKSATAPFIFTYKATGEPVHFGRGVSYINIVPKTEKVVFEQGTN
ncbi:MAG: DUF3048 domain-containing protein [Oscillospiraceae bacterium]|jgi:hypothetical protein|nr:DUF3048 domain-containing protein [Oscillospiraceae bacterium]